MGVGIRAAIVVVSGFVFVAPGYSQSLLNPERAKNVTSLFGKNFDLWENPTFGTHAPSSPGDPDLGEQRILTSFESYRPLNFQIAQSAVWTDNAALTDGGELSDFYSSTELLLNYLPQIAANTYAEIRAGYSFYRYADHSRLDFDEFEASLGLIHVMRDFDDLSLWVRYNYTRFLTARGHDDFFTDHSIELGLYQPIPLGPRQSAYGAVTSEFSLDGDPGFAARNEYSVIVGYKYSPADRLQLEAYYQLSVYDYEERGRDDLLQIAGLAATTHLTELVDLVLAASYSFNDSDLPGADYEVGDIGASLSLKFDF